MKKYRATYSMVATWVAEFEADDIDDAVYIIESEPWTVEDEPDKWDKFRINEIEDLETGLKYKVSIKRTYYKAEKT